MIRIAVLGPIPRDTIYTHNQEIINKYGCVSHPVIALSKLLGEDGEVIPVSHVHKKDHRAISELFAPYKNIRQDHISSVDDKGTVIELRFLDQNNRVEKQTACMKPIRPEDIKGLEQVDVFVFVPITDFEISLSTLRAIQENYKGLIVFDAHGPTTTMGMTGDRYRKFWVDMDEWLPYIDILKMNLEESQACWFKNEYDAKEMSSYDEEKTDHLDDMAEHVLEGGVKYFYVTLDARGCVVYFRENGKTRKEFIKSIYMENVVDTTGCGDSFAGGLAYGFSKYNDPFKAAQYANALGALRTQGKSFDVFKDKEGTDRLISEHYS
ncbi:carbohydrate kinase family protein [Zeaxanthinibacter enoshimensis]|uniref:Adenosine kinase n=1 Tax=Zeaxanthinibacter enoshimensis TaxID=392009 RepID=A0A4R6TG31_9FLAO|nr:carbohydrate kinase family protein [Zeaxanthinibacter enoshimensis]TDQ29167.1 adenosine kinase [Zeaxanthinibacter enoshimensis]